MRRAGGPAPTMKAVDFYKLPRAIQDRFVGSVTSGFPPAPLLTKKSSATIKLAWLGVSGACFAVLLVVARVGYGALDSRLSIQSALLIPAYLVLVFGVAYGLLQAYARLVRERALPYAPGVYLFPACLIDARDDRFRVYDTRDLANATVQGSALRVAFKGGATFAFPLANPAMGPSLVEQVHAGRERAMRAHASEEAKELVAVDPLHVPRFSSPVGPRMAYELRRPPWGKLGVAIAAALGITAGPALWAVRNAGSDKTMYAFATQANDTASYQQYMVRGARFRAEVGDILLPRSELRDAEKVGTVEALLDYKEAHPESKIEIEVTASIRKAMLAELEKAKEPGTLAALRAFAAQYPEHGVEPELGAAVHAVYARELEAFKQRTSPKNKAVIPLVERLFAWGEKNGGTIEVRFQRKEAPSLERADKAVSKTRTFMGVVTYPTRHFDEKRSAPREAALGQVLTALAPALSPELFEAKVGPAVAEADLPAPEVPTLFVTHTTEWSGHTYTLTRPRGTYIGVRFVFDAKLVIPGDPKPYRFRTEIFRPAATALLKEEDPNIDPADASAMVYESMASAAFETFGSRLLTNLGVK